MVDVFAVSTGVVVIVVAVAVVLVVALISVSMRGRGKRDAQQRSEARHELEDAHDRVAVAEHERDVAREGTEDRPPER